MEALGLTIQRDPELYLRLLSLLSMIAATIVVYVIAWRHSHDWWWSTAAACVVGYSPLLLFYAFEARVWTFATACTVIYLALLASALARPSRSLLIAGALLGIFIGHVYIFIAALFGGLAIAAAIRFVIARDRKELLTIAAFAIPGALTSVAEGAFITYTYPAGYGFPLFVARSIRQLLSVTLSVFSSSGLSTPPMFLRGLSMLLLGATIAIVLFVLRRSPLIVMPIGALISLLTILVFGSTHGYVIVPRYEVPLIGALLCSFAFAFTKEARPWLTLLALAQLFAAPSALRDVFLKGNGKPIARMIKAAPPAAVIVQHPLRLGYPDPLYSFAVSFYLHGRIPVYELPMLRDVTAAEGVLFYFDGGQPLFDSYKSMPIAEWETKLRGSPWDRIWVVIPVPRDPAEARQSAAFRAALANSGFELARGQRVGGYPMAQVGLFVRRATATK